MSARQAGESPALGQLPALLLIISVITLMEFCESGSGDGCGRSFPKKSSLGLCAKCTKLASLDEGSPEYAQWKVCLWIYVCLKVLFTLFRPSCSVRRVELLGNTLRRLHVVDVPTRKCRNRRLLLNLVTVSLSFVDRSVVMRSQLILIRYSGSCSYSRRDISCCPIPCHGCAPYKIYHIAAAPYNRWIDSCQG
jgi:hypothetical protein